MTKERMMELLLLDRNTKAEAEKRIHEKSVIIYEDFEENFDLYMADFGIDKNGDEDIVKEYEKFKEMVKTHIPLCDWSLIEDNGKWYYFAYCN